MTAIDIELLSDGMHRLAKLALDSGEAETLEDALRLFATYRIHVATGPSLRHSPAQQAALLTLVNAGRRAFLGGITVTLADDAPLRVPLPGAATLAQAIRLFGGSITPAAPDAFTPRILIGDSADPRGDGPTLRLAMRDWRFACLPPGAPGFADEADAMVLTGIAAGAMALAEIFQHLRGGNPAAGRRACGMSLWDFSSDWRALDAAAHLPERLPAAAWLIGLGNLGQAYLWALGMLPYADPGSVRLTLQDFDRVAPSNDSTSMLTSSALMGQQKTRAMAQWVEQRGFTTTLVERRFDANLRIGSDDPAIALCGVDNGTARAALERAGFGRIFEAGLGNGPSDFLALRLHSFPGPRTAQALWPPAAPAEADLLDRPAYRDLAARGAERCGLVRLAGRTVGAPFVGAFAGALVIAELVRLANGGPATALLDLHLRNTDQRVTITQDTGFAFNPGLTASLPRTVLMV